MSQESFSMRPLLLQRLTSLGIAFLFLSLSVGLFLYQKGYLDGVHSLKNCPTSCTFTSDCHAVSCSKQVQCVQNQCVLPPRHTTLFYYIFLFILFVVGLVALLHFFYIQNIVYTIHPEKISYKSLFSRAEQKWDEVLGVTYHCVDTRFLGSPATVYTLVGEKGIFSFLVMGLRDEVMTREMDVGSFLLGFVSVEDAQQWTQKIEQFSQLKIEHEYDW